MPLESPLSVYQDLHPGSELVSKTSRNIGTKLFVGTAIGRKSAEKAMRKTLVEKEQKIRTSTV